MDELSNFCQIIKNKLGDEENLCIGQAREIVNSINNFLYSNYDGIGKTYALGSSFEYSPNFIGIGRNIIKKYLIVELTKKNAKL